MGKMISIFLMLAGCLWLVGCQEQNSHRASIKGVKFTDIRPMYSRKNLPKKTLLAEIAVFEIQLPADNFNAITDAWDKLIADHINFADQALFAANGLKASFGNAAMWPAVREKLIKADSKIINTTTLTIDEKYSNKVNVCDLTGEQTVLYNSSVSGLQKHRLAEGAVIFNISIENIYETKQSIRIKILPAFLPYNAPSNSRNIILFDTVKLNFQASPGDFVLLGPEKCEPGMATLAGLFFTVPSEIQMAKVYVIECRKIYE